MSRIAEALAKAKEKAGDISGSTAANGAINPLPNKSAERLLIVARRRQRFWIAITILVLPLSIFATWTHLKENNLLGPRSAEKSPSTSKDKTRLADDAKALASEAGGKQNLGSAFARRVDLLPISAVMPGEPPRIMVHGRIFRLGETVENGIVFTGIQNGELIFTDTDGAMHKRRP
jgi:hypothetical protein